MLASRATPAVAPRLLLQRLLLCCSLAMLPLAAHAAPAQHPALTILLPRTSLHHYLHHLSPEESVSDEEVSEESALEPMTVRALVDLLLSAPPTPLDPPTPRLQHHAHADLARMPLKRQVRQDSLSHERIKASRTYKPIKPYLTNPRYFLESLGGKLNLGNQNQLSKKSGGSSWLRSRDSILRRLSYLLNGNLDQIVSVQELTEDGVLDSSSRLGKDNFL
ncbi:uncharacterized protein [Procambarus clarkii]|uniref:uncharacterized protein n=1 Tax=Procambarus clarkii TaxID=6728 RepID=UPI00374212CE